MPRITDAIVSKYQRARIHASEFVRGEQTTFQANFNGALDEGVVIESVTWFTATPWALILSSPQVSQDQRSVSVDCLIGWAGPGDLKCVVTLSNGQVRNQLYRISIIDGPYYVGESMPTQGPQSVTAVALSVAVTPESASDTYVQNSGVGFLEQFEAVAVGGSGAYAFQWSIESASPSNIFEIVDPGDFITAVNVDADNPEGTYTATLRMTVTDESGHTATDTASLAAEITVA